MTQPPTASHPAKGPIIDAVGVLDLVYEWVESIRRHDLGSMIAAQRRLRSDHDIWLTLGSPSDCRRADQ